MHAVIIASAIKGWSPIVNLWLLGLAPIVAVASGLLAGAYPAYRDAAVEPAQALRST